MPTMISAFLWVYASPADMRPCGTVLYLYRPHSVTNVVKCLSCGCNGTEWYPCQQSNTDLTFRGGIEDTIVQGDAV